MLDSMSREKNVFEFYWFSPELFVPTSRDHFISLFTEQKNQGIPVTVGVAHQARVLVFNSLVPRRSTCSYQTWNANQMLEIGSKIEDFEYAITAEDIHTLADQSKPSKTKL